MMLRLLINLLLFALPIFVVSASGQNKYWRDADGEFVVHVGDDMPSWSCVTLSGDTLDSDFFYGRVSVIEFMASWCPFGKGQMRALEDLVWRKERYRGINIICFSEDFATDTLAFREMTEEWGIGYAVSWDDDGDVFRKFATRDATVTRLIVVDSDGKIVKMYDEFSRKTFRDTRRTIKRLLKNRAR